MESFSFHSIQYSYFSFPFNFEGIEWNGSRACNLKNVLTSPLSIVFHDNGMKISFYSIFQYSNNGIEHLLHSIYSTLYTSIILYCIPLFVNCPTSWRTCCCNICGITKNVACIGSSCWPWSCTWKGCTAYLEVIAIRSLYFAPSVACDIQACCRRLMLW